MSERPRAARTARSSSVRRSARLLVPVLAAGCAVAVVILSGGGNVVPAAGPDLFPADSFLAGGDPASAPLDPAAAGDSAAPLDSAAPPDSAASPDFAAPVPVLLIPGWMDRAAHLEPFRRRLVEAGWPRDRVRALSFADPVGSNRDHARELARAVLELREATGAAEVDVVAHSMGGLALRYHLANQGAAGVRRVVFLGTPHRGTLLAHAAWGEGSEEMEPGSPLLTTVNASHPLPPGIPALSVRTRLDLRIVPAESAWLPGADNVEVCCPTHEGLLDHDLTFREIVEFLRRAPSGPRPESSEGGFDAGRGTWRPPGGSVSGTAPSG